MQDYPLLGIDANGYQPDWSDGTEVVRSENGEAWLYRRYDKEQGTLTIKHPSLKASQEAELRSFYRDYKHERVRFFDPRTREYYVCMMPSPPKLASMSGSMLANIEMTLLVVRQ